MKRDLAAFAAALSLVSALAGCVTPAAGPPAPVARVFDPQGAIPIASVVTVPAGHDLVFVSGMLADNLAAAGQPPRFAPDTKTQALQVLKKLKDALGKQGMSLADVTTMRVFLVGDPAVGGKLDFAGFNEAFRTEFGGAAQPNRPTRTVILGNWRRAFAWPARVTGLRGSLGCSVTGLLSHWAAQSLDCLRQGAHVIGRSCAGSAAAFAPCSSAHRHKRKRSFSRRSRRGQ